MKNILVSMHPYGNAQRQFLAGVSYYAHTRNDWALHFDPSPDRLTAESFARDGETGISGAIICETGVPDLESILVYSPVPVVVFGSPRETLAATHSPVGWSMSDDEGIGAFAAEHFTSLGTFRSYAFVADPLDSGWSRGHCRGFKTRLKHLAKDISVFTRPTGEGNVARRCALSSWLKTLAKPAAVLAASVLILVTVFSCKTKELAWKHPLQGCWQLESYRTADDPDTYEKHFHAQQYKYFGNGGELVITFSERDGLNFPSFQMCGMEQRLNGKALTDRHGVPIQYEMDGTDIHIWHWMKHINENKDSVEQIERWRRIKADPHLDRLFREISATCKLKQTDGTAGMWKLDSIKVWKSDFSKTKTIPMTSPIFLIISDSQLYMRFGNEGSHNNRFLDFVIHGDCGELKMPNSHQIAFPEITYDICPETNSGSLVLSDQQTNSARWYYERVPNPEFVIQMLRPALAE